ncbi:response regulator transcription factor [Ruminococcus sp. Marseille-P6503]|uniref:LytR/AlgR family response regulator transcription factor n=1 Tax=Ruminococcus sp. Marseille-P6503 TaxID=2364796 RepID=UPI000F52957A|nr:response regulator transcription factor [Ruminococcus sp. Marseille-P6503]
MIKIAVIGKNICDSRFIKEKLADYDIKTDIDLQIRCFEKCETLDEEYSVFNRFDLIILYDGYSERDSSLSGIELAGRIRSVYGDEKAELIFISDNERSACEAIRFRPFDFILNPVTSEALFNALDRYVRNKCGSFHRFSFIKDRTENIIMVSRIRYLQSMGKRLIIHTVNDNIEIYGRLSEVMKQDCFSDFILIHKSYLVNPGFIERYTYNKVYVYGKEKEELPVSRNRQDEVKKLLIKI